ncbi:hypothetical protein CYMTET_5956 [Cymbomonas tetramitiformis]|uniref:Uncharacterized protein n=1 Tax=Cymbomonas tetramitiformis TaxID=36881 RepID=A0AAE0LIW6_9CHLO|nr:hypothetical protein CYMTET_5956 [Cymbomonas tetramitiformis]
MRPSFAKKRSGIGKELTTDLVESSQVDSVYLCASSSSWTLGSLFGRRKFTFFAVTILLVQAFWLSRRVTAQENQALSNSTTEQYEEGAALDNPATELSSTPKKRRRRSGKSTKQSATSESSPSPPPEDSDATSRQKAWNRVKNKLEMQSTKTATVNLFQSSFEGLTSAKIKSTAAEDAMLKKSFHRERTSQIMQRRDPERQENIYQLYKSADAQAGGKNFQKAVRMQAMDSRKRIMDKLATHLHRSIVKDEDEATQEAKDSANNFLDHWDRKTALEESMQLDMYDPRSKAAYVDLAPPSQDGTALSVDQFWEMKENGKNDDLSSDSASFAEDW